jgi:sodium-dependent dicarboxylate transporter 2/3/5
VLTRVAIRGVAHDLGSGAAAIARSRAELGPLSRGERRTLVIFTCTVLAWVTRADITVGSVTLRGWASTLSLGDYIHDATIAIAAAIALFVTPVEWSRGVFVLDWKTARQIPWGILILFGGGIALGKGFAESGLASEIARAMGAAPGAPIVLLVLATALVVTFLTEITSNTATATIFLPILAATAVGLGKHPFLLMIPATVSASCAFMLPVATPPNAIVYSSGSITMTGMVKTGILLNFIGVALVTIILYLLVIPLFGISLSQVPAWAG